MNAFLRTLCLAALVAAGSAWAQQSQSDNPQNPHSTTAKDKQGTSTPSSVTNEQVDQNEKVNPHHPDNRNTKPSGTATNEQIDAAERGQPHHVQNKDRDKLGEAGQTGTMAGQTDQMADMDHDAMMKNATPQMMLQRMHMSNLHEIEMGKIAEQNGSDRVKTYAKTLQQDHQDADKQVKALAQKKGVTLNDTPKNPQMQQHMDQDKQRFSSLKGQEFDRMFANRMSMEHRKVISMAQNYKQNCSDQDVCQLIDTLLPKLQQHQQMADQLKGPSAQGRAPEPMSR
jgi:predicted outer membrane protein